MVILGINDGHNSGCTIFVNGKNKCTLSEEKITRKKNEYGFPAFKNSGLEYLNIDNFLIQKIQL